MSDDKPAGISDGARRLREYLDVNKLSIPRFCEAAGARGIKLDRIFIKRVLDGVRGQRITVDFAKNIAEATDGFVAIESFASETLRPMDAPLDPIEHKAAS